MATKKEARPTTENKKSRQELIAERRKVRVDLGSGRNVMSTPEEEGLVFRYVNDEVRAGVNRIDNFLQRGWSVYDKESGYHAEIAATDNNVGLGAGNELIVGKHDNGQPLRAVLMCIDRETYDLDQALKEEERREQESGIQSAADRDSGLYGSIQIENR